MFGSLVSSNTTRRGTKKIRSKVSEFGRLMRLTTRSEPENASQRLTLRHHPLKNGINDATNPDAHYNQGGSRCQTRGVVLGSHLPSNLRSSTSSMEATPSAFALSSFDPASTPATT